MKQFCRVYFFALLIACAAMALAGCANKHGSSNYTAGGSHLAQVRGYIAEASYLNLRTKKHADPIGKELLEAQGEVLDRGQESAGRADTAATQATKDYWTLFRTHNDWPAKYFGWKNWEHLRWIILGYLGLGAAAIGLHAFGLVGPARFIFGILPFSNPFRMVANRFSSARDAAKVEVIVKQPETPTSQPEVTVTSVPTGQRRTAGKRKPKPQE